MGTTDAFSGMPGCLGASVDLLSSAKTSKILYGSHFLTRSCKSSPLCIRSMCCLKLSSRGHIFSLFLHDSDAHWYDFCNSPTRCTLFLCRSRSLTVVKPLSLRLHFGHSHLNGLSCFSWCFLSTVSAVDIQHRGSYALMI
jgi:hypothetical protein